AGEQKQLTEGGYWYAAAPPQEWMEIVAQDPKARDDWDKKYIQEFLKVFQKKLQHSENEHCNFFKSSKSFPFCKRTTKLGVQKTSIRKPNNCLTNG
ncbi:MAG: hypothetical protein II277_07485, partial [Bacteroidales bacterium]|nr:hypothetical protein [Bacteroidales bacterium]